MRKTNLLLVVLLAGAVPVQAGALSGKVTCSGQTDNANALVYVEKIDGKTFTPPTDPVVMDQKGKEFIPKVLPVLVGTRVDFLNSDPFNHNVFSPDKCADKFNLGTWPTGETKSFTFVKPCEAVMLCNVHPEMVAYIIALETPYFGVTDEEGNFSIPDLPDGTYTVSVWHEELDKQSQSVSVSGPSKADFTLK
jgi:plastocyanin